MSETLKKYQELLSEIKAEKGYKPNMGAAGKALLVECMQEATRRHSASKTEDKSKQIMDRPKRSPRATFSSLHKNMYKCNGLSADACTVAPHCFYQPKAKRCVLRSGKDIVNTFDNPKRAGVLSQLTDEYAPIGRAWPLHPLYDVQREQAYLNQERKLRLGEMQSAGSAKTIEQIAAEARVQAQERARVQAQERARVQAQERARVQAQERAIALRDLIRPAQEVPNDLRDAIRHQINIRNNNDRNERAVRDYELLHPQEQPGQMNEDDRAEYQAELDRDQMMQHGVAHIREYDRHF